MREGEVKTLVNNRISLRGSGWKVLEMSSSDQDTMSDSASSPLSYIGSPHRSPCQQVPQLATCFTELTCADFNGRNGVKDGPYLRIVEQPQDTFRFRYKSEMVGTHGCLLGKTSTTSKNKTHPTVELVNYNRRAVIRCRLEQHLKPDEHPHQLLEDEQEEREVSAEVPERGSYRVGFAGMGIIHTAKKDVPGLLFKKYKDRQKLVNSRELLNYCEAEAKGINLNIVRLRFSAHDKETDREICPPVFSEPIHNMKSAATNDLRICRMSKIYGRVKGGEDVYILVEKVNKKNIEILFVERNEDNEVIWSTKAHFLQSDVHHQYAIVFRTPAYRDQQITSDVKVTVELVRPSDGRTSEPKEFTYRADPLCKQSKKRKASSPYSSFSSSGSLSSIKSLGLPATVLEINQNSKAFPENDFVMNLMMPNAVPVMMETQTNADLGDALMGIACEENTHSALQLQCTVSPMMPQADPPNISLNSTEFANLLRADLEPHERDDFAELCRQYMTPSMTDFMQDQLEADSGRGKPIFQAAKPQELKQSSRNAQSSKPQSAVEKPSGDYSAVYSPEHGSEVKKLVKEICDIIRTKTGFKKQVVREKLERLFAMRLSNGDTFLHMSLVNNRMSFEYIVKLLHTMRMPHLLNLTNDLEQTILHAAIVNDAPSMVTVLIANGCDPMIGDQDGNNAVHYAVQCGACLQPLLDAVRKHGVQCDLNAGNKEKQTALHLAAVPGSAPSAIASAAECIRLLLQHGASHNARDADGRTPLHLAAYDDCLPVARTLLEHMPESDIDAVDGRGYTALQIVCDGEIRENTVAFLELLITKKADPNTHEPHTLPARALARGKPALREALNRLVPHDADIKSEPEDDYESADEGDDTCLSDLPLYMSELARALDASGAWRPLAARLQHDALTNWYGNTPSPTRTLLTQLKECQDANITSKSLVLILEDLGQLEAAQIIRSRACLD